jgi:hypothetical protein
MTALAIERTSNVYWLRRARGELWFEDRGFDPLPDAGWTRLATGARWIASGGDAIAMLEDDAVTAFTAALARPMFRAPGLGAALAGAAAAVVDPVRHRVYVATPTAIVAIDEERTAAVAPVAARALALSADRRRLYAAGARAIACITLDDGAVADVADVPGGGAVGGLATSPSGLIATVVGPGGAALVGITLRHGACRTLRALPAELAGAAVVADHTGGLTLAAPDRLYRCEFDGSDLAVCFAPP